MLFNGMGWASSTTTDTTSMLKLYVLLLMFVILACNDTTQSNVQDLPNLYPQPNSVEANPKRGYAINQVTGDSVQPIVNSLGDTVVTGVWIPAAFKKIPNDSIGKPRTFSAPPGFASSKPRDPSKSSNLLLRSQRLDLTNLRVTPLGGGDSSARVINARGDTVVTGKKLPVNFRSVKARHSPPVTAMPPIAKDAARTNIRNIDVGQGLNSPHVLGVMEDRRRNLWLAYWGGGISIYNGGSLRHYGERNGLICTQTMNLLQDKRGNIWGATWGGGLFMYDGVYFHHYDQRQGALSDHVWSVMEDSRGDIWFVSTLGVTRYDGNSFLHLTKKEGLSEDRSSAIVEDRDGRMWVCNSAGIIDIIDGNTITHLSTYATTGADVLYDAIADRNGRVWIGTNKGAFCIDGDSITQITTEHGLKDKHVTSMFQDSHGNIWLGTYFGGLYMYDGHTVVGYTEEDGLSNNQIRTIREDSQGNILVGTFGSGLFILNVGSLKYFTTKEGLSNHFVNRICKDNKGHYWFGTEEGGLNWYDGNVFQHISLDHGLSSYRVWPVIEDKRGTIWFGTWEGGAYAIDGKTIKNYTRRSGLSDRTVLTIYEDREGKLLFGTFGGGVTIYDGHDFRHMSDRQGMSNNCVIAILQDSRGHYWFGTERGGVTQYDGKRLRHFTEREGLGGNNIRFIHEDQYGNMWFGTDGMGVSVYDGARFTHITEREGLASNYVASIVRDNKNTLYVGTGKGITRITTRPDKSSIHGSVYSTQVIRQQEGLKGTAFYLQSAFIDDNNQSWWGTDKGLVTIDGDKLAPSTREPLLSLKRIDINGRYIDYHNLDKTTKDEIEFSSLQSFENYPHNLELPYNQNHLTFYFAGIDWTAPHKVQYSYRVLGLNDTWSSPSTESKADYRNVPYGDYTLQVCAVGEGGDWSDPISYAFVIRPPWWHTWWAYGAYAIVALVVLRFVAAWRERKLQVEKRRLEQTVSERTAELSHAMRKTDELLLNILPEGVAQELKSKGHAEAKYFDEITVLFTDFRNFTQVAEGMSPTELVSEMHACFEAFDAITEKYQIEKIKTIGDAYMAAGGMSAGNEASVRNTVLAALEMQDYIKERVVQQTAAGKTSFEMRVGIHTGPVVAGIVGVKKFQYDIWGDTVNTAARMESSGEVGKVNISESTYAKVKDNFKCIYRGKIEAKNKGELDMYFVEGLD